MIALTCFVNPLWKLKELKFSGPFGETIDRETRGGGDSHMKWTGMLVVSLRGVNFGFWSRLGCSGQNVINFSRQDLV